MKILVQKFGGTSVRDENGRKHAYKHIKSALDEGYKIICVVSAMGRSGEPYATDTLLSLISGKRAMVSPREKDLMMSCGEIISSIVFSDMLNHQGIKATSLTGGQAGFRTTDEFTNAKIVKMKVERIYEQLEDHDVVVVAGFQGITENGDVTTLGRGGSDTSASALGVALNAEYIDIFTDVDGIMTADPRIVKDAQRMDVVTYAEICNLAYQGAKVVHPHAVEIAMHGKIPLRVRSTYSDSLGTLVTSKGEHHHRNICNRLVTGIAHLANITQIKVYAKEGQFDLQEQVFTAMADSEISVDFINISPTVVAYTVSDDVADKAVKLLEELGYSPEVTSSCAKVSVVGAGIAGVPGVTAKIVTALAKNRISILQSADSHTTIWVLVREEQMVQAVNALHEIFDLHEAVH